MSSPASHKAVPGRAFKTFWRYGWPYRRAYSIGAALAVAFVVIELLMPLVVKRFIAMLGDGELTAIALWQFFGLLVTIAVCVSTVPGSVKFAVIETSSPRFATPPSPGLVVRSMIVGATFQTASSWTASAEPLSSSLAVRLTMYCPLSAGVNVKLSPAPDATG